MIAQFDPIIGILVSKEAIAIYIAIAAVTVSIITYLFERRRFRITALIEELRTLNDIKHREARKVIYGSPSKMSFKILGVSGDKMNETELRTMCESIVRSDFNEAATLIRHKIIESTLFVEEYWWIILRSWYEVEVEIKRRRENEGPRNYMANLEELKNKAEDYASKKYSTDLQKLKHLG